MPIIRKGYAAMKEQLPALEKLLQEENQPKEESIIQIPDEWCQNGSHLWPGGL